jgi:hypothetical protein
MKIVGKFSGSLHVLQMGSHPTNNPLIQTVLVNKVRIISLNEIQLVMLATKFYQHFLK